MTKPKPSAGETRVWAYLLNNKLADEREVAKACNVRIATARKIIARIGTPREVFEKEELVGRKDDQAKAPYHLIAPELLEGVAQVLEFGARKYDARNWEKGMAWHRPFSALMRHMWAWWRGENTDPETGMSHLWHAACCIMFLVAYEARSVGADDRPKS